MTRDGRVYYIIYFVRVCTAQIEEAGRDWKTIQVSSRGGGGGGGS